MKKRYIIGISVLLSGMPLFLLNNCLNHNHHDFIPRTFSMSHFEGIENLVPIVVAGSGPGGLSAALYGARAKKYVLVLDGNKPGGLLTETTWVENWPGSERILGVDLIDNIRNHAVQFGAHFISDSIESIDTSQWPFIIRTEEGKTLRALTVIIATGALPRRLHVPGEEQYWGAGVTTCAVCDAPFYKDKDVVVVGGGDSALEESMQLSSYAKTVTILARNSQLRASGRMQDLIRNNRNIRVKYDMSIKEIGGDGTKVTHIVVSNTLTHKEETMPIDGVFLAIGHEPNTLLLKNKINMDSHGYISVKHRSQETSIPGIFAAGDVEDNVYRQAVVAAGSGVKAALDADRFLNEHGFTQELEQALKNQWFLANKSPQKEHMVVVKDINDLKKMIMEESSLPLIVDFYADYCPSCMQMLPLLESLANSYEGKALFVKVNTQESTGILEEYNIMKVPALLIFKKGQLIKRHEVGMNRQELTIAIEEAL